MKLSTVAVVLLTAVALGTSGRPMLAAPGAPPAHPAAGASSNPNWIGLTPQQQAKMKTRLAKYNADMMALQNDKTTPMQDKMQKARALQKAYEDDMNGMLTPVQKQRIAEKRKEFMSSPAGKDMARRKAFADARFKQIMDLRQKIVASLTPQQKQQIGQLQTSEYGTMQSIQGDKTLSDAAKQTKLEALSKDSKVKMDAILTPTQRADFAKLQTLYPAPPGGAPPPPAN